MGAESCWSKLRRNGYGVPVVAIFRISHYRGDLNRCSYTAAIPNGLLDGVFINRLRLPVLLKAVEKRFTTPNKRKPKRKTKKGKS